MPLHAATIGSINIDYIVELNEIDSLDTLFLNGHIMRPIEAIVGGNGSFFAEAMLEAGFSTSKLFTTLGGINNHTPDAAAKIAIEYLKNQQVEVIYSLDAIKPTGKVIMIYISGNKRLMIADRGAGDSFRLDNLPPNIYKLLESMDLVYISGYGLQDKLRNDAIQNLLRFAYEAGVFTIIDIVPHQIYKSISLNQYKELLIWANAISVEGPTLKGFLGYDDTSITSPKDIEIIKEISRSLCDLSFIRVNDKSDFLILNPDSTVNFNIPFPPHKAGRRFMDRILAHFLKSYLSNGRTIEDVMWINDINRLSR